MYWPKLSSNGQEGEEELDRAEKEEASSSVQYDHIKKLEERGDEGHLPKDA